jgi:hypothetical protein
VVFQNHRQVKRGSAGAHQANAVGGGEGRAHGDDTGEPTRRLAKMVIWSAMTMTDYEPLAHCRRLLREFRCPRPANGDPANTTIGQCMDWQHCGCEYGVACGYRAVPRPIDGECVDQEKLQCK